MLGSVVEMLGACQKIGGCIGSVGCGKMGDGTVEEGDDLCVLTARALQGVGSKIEGLAGGNLCLVDGVKLVEGLLVSL